MEPDYELRNALMVFYEKKNISLTFLVDYCIGTVMTVIIEYKKKKVKYWYIFPLCEQKQKLNEEERIKEKQKMIGKPLKKIGPKENIKIFPGANNDKPWSKKIIKAQKTTRAVRR